MEGEGGGVDCSRKPELLRMLIILHVYTYFPMGPRRWIPSNPSEEELPKIWNGVASLRMSVSVMSKWGLGVMRR